MCVGSFFCGVLVTVLLELAVITIMITINTGKSEKEENQDECKANA